MDTDEPCDLPATSTVPDDHERDSGRIAQLTAFFTGLVSFALLYCPQPVLHLISADFKIPPYISALTITVPSLFLSFSSILMIWLGTKSSLARLLPIAIIVAALLNLAAILSSVWSVVVIWRAVFGVCIGIVPAAIMGYLATEIAPQRMGRAMSWYIAGTGSGGLLGRLTAGLLAEPYGYRVALGVVSIIALIVGVGMLAILPRPQGKSSGKHKARGIDRAQLNRAMTTPSVVSLYILGFLLMSAFVGVSNYLSFLLSSPRFGLSQSGLTLSFLPLAIGIFAVPFFGMFYDRWGPRIMLCLAFSMLFAGALATLMSSIAILFLGIVLIALGAFAGHSSASATLARQRLVDPTYAASLYMFFYYLGSSFAGNFSGFVLGRGGWSAVVVFTVSLACIGTVITLGFVERSPPPPKKRDQL